MSGPARGPRLDGQTCVVTGAARGIGRSEAETLARRGAAVLCVDIANTGDVVEAIRAAGGEAASWMGDLTNVHAAEEVLALARGLHRPITCLVNNAGRVADRMIYNLSDDDWRLVVDASLTTTFRLSRAFSRHWRGESHGQGRRIINTTSESGLYGNAGQTNYAAAKAGVAALTLTMAAELAPLGVTVNAVAPRARTPMSESAFGDLSGIGETLAPQFVADVVAWLASETAADITGQVFVVAGAQVQRLQTWSTVATARQPDEWTPDELERFRGNLFRGAGSWQIPPPIRDLFSAREGQP